jgi:AraC-type DNA-binding domain-containing proteins
MAILVSNMHENSIRGIERGDQVAATAGAGLACSCGKEGDLIRVAEPSRGIERIEARFHGNGFSPHRHDTYALGITLSGVQTFHYRGASQFSLPGNVIALHPDEVHDGAAGTEDGLIYRMLYLPPGLIADAGGQDSNPLPFVGKPVIEDPLLRLALADLLDDLTRDPQDLLLDDALSRIAAGLRRNASAVRDRVGPSARRAVLACRDYLDAHADEHVSSGELEEVAGIGRYELARQFRRTLGTSPHRYLVMRRLDRARRELRAGAGLADAAAAAGFSDQAHFTRHFKKTYGMTPGRWVALSRAS